MLLIHHNDNDGKLSAAVVLFNLSGQLREPITLMEMDYKDTFRPEALIPDEMVYIVDFSLRVEEMESLLARTDRVYWFDHHKSSIDKYKDFPHQIAGIREEGARAGCRLVWDWFNDDVSGKNYSPDHPPYNPPLVVELVSDYDTWTLADERSKFLNYGLQAHDTNPSNRVGLWRVLLTDNAETLKVVEGGKAVLGFVQRRGLELARSYGYVTEILGHRVFVMHNPNPGMDWFWLLRDKADVFARVAFDGRNYSVSLYSEKVDVEEIARQFGGGGHSGAAGFVSPTFPWAPTSKL